MTQDGTEAALRLQAHARYGKRSSMHILLIDDDPLDAETVRRVLRNLPTGHELEAVSSADEALRTLSERLAGGGGNRYWTLPDLILVDLNMPGMSGQEFLSAIESNPRLNAIPVVVLTTSGLPDDVKTCFDRGADGYFVKPLEYARFADLLTRIIDYWFLCETPQRSPAISP
jgi:CheY-like chemotaxis protein